MATAQQAAQRTPEERFVIHGVSWDTYERLLEDLADSPVPRVTYDRGTLELMSPSAGHENLNRLLSRMIDVLSEELDVIILSLGSTTWRRKELLRGLEADSCYYITNEPLMRGRLELDLTVDPPPDLAIEVEVSQGAVNKLAIYAALGVPEVWLVAAANVRVLRLEQNGGYSDAGCSSFFPPAAMDGIRQFLAERGLPNETAWIKGFRSWVRENLLK
jgi:Uma2 family endonuclease